MYVECPFQQPHSATSPCGSPRATLATICISVKKRFCLKTLSFDSERVRARW
jgi:hypothetical protein